MDDKKPTAKLLLSLLLRKIPICLNYDKQTCSSVAGGEHLLEEDPWPALLVNECHEDGPQAGVGQERGGPRRVPACTNYKIYYSIVKDPSPSATEAKRPLRPHNPYVIGLMADPTRPPSSTPPIAFWFYILEKSKYVHSAKFCKS